MQIFKDCTFEYEEFCDLNLQEVDFTRTRFLDCNFTNCNLSLAKIDETRFQNVSFKECKILGVNFSKSNPFLLEMNFQNCIVKDCSFAELILRKRLFTDCKVHECDFYKCDLTEANFSGSSLDGTLFSQTILKKTQFQNAKNYLINPLENKIRKARFSIPEAMSLLSFLEIEIE